MMKLINLVCLSFILAFSTICIVAYDDLRGTSVVSEHNVKGEGLSSQPSSLLMFESAEKKLASAGCSIQPDPFGHVDIPDGTASIEHYAFSTCTQLVSINIPASVAIINDWAFYGCTSLTQVNLSPDSALTHIGNNSFSYAGLLSMTIPETVVDIGNYAFYGCSSFSQVNISPNSALMHIGIYSFYMTALLSMTIPSTVIDIGNGAFMSCDTLSQLDLSPISALTYIGKNAFSNSGLEYVTIPPSVVTIDDLAFSGCASLVMVTFSPNSVLARIGNSAFQSSKLMSVMIPASVVSIGDYAFNYIYGSLTQINFSPNSVLTHIGNNAFSYSALLSVTIPASVIVIGDGAFSWCNSLTQVTFAMDGALTTIGDMAFIGTRPTQINLPPSVQNVGYRAFSNMGMRICMVQPDASGHVEIASGTIGIPNFAFYGCIGLLSVNIPSSVTTIGSYAFHGGSPASLLSVTFDESANQGSELVTIGDSAFESTQIYSITVPASVTNIGDAAFAYCYSLAQVNISPISTLTRIGRGTFQGSWTFSSVTIPASVIAIDDSAFENSYNLAQINFSPNSALTHIGNYAFQYTRFESFTIPRGVVSIGDAAFGYCTSLRQIDFSPNSALTHIGNYTFRYSGLLSVTIPAGVTKIGMNAFADSDLTKVTFLKSLPGVKLSIGEFAFAMCIDLDSVTFSEGLERVAYNAFYQTMLTHVDLPSSLTKLEYSAFESHVEFACLNPEVVYNPSTLCQTSIECLRGSHDISGECIPCEVGQSTLRGGDQCIAAEIVPLLSENRCRGYKTIRNVLPANSVSIRYMPNTEEKMIVFSDVPSAFFNSVSTVEARFMISHHKVSVGGNSFANVLTKGQDYYDQRYLLAVPSYTNQTFFDLSFPSCINHVLKPGQYISKLRLIFYDVPPESMLTFDTVVGCKDYHLDPSSAFYVNEGDVCTNNS